MDAFRAGRLSVRHDLHLGIGFLAATAPPPAAGANGTRAGGLRLRRVATERRPALDHRGGQRAARPAAPRARRDEGLVPPHRRGAGRHAPHDRGRPAGLRRLDEAADVRLRRRLLRPLRRGPARRARARPRRRRRQQHGRPCRARGRAAAPRAGGGLGLLAPSLAWLRGRPWAPLLRLVPPQLGLLQPTPRAWSRRRAPRRPGRPGRLDGRRRGRVPAVLPDARAAAPPSTPRPAASTSRSPTARRVLDAPARAAAARAVRLGPPRPPRPARLRRPRAAGAPGRRAPRARLRPRPPARAAAGHARRAAPVPRRGATP